MRLPRFERSRSPEKLWFWNAVAPIESNDVGNVGVPSSGTFLKAFGPITVSAVCESNDKLVSDPVSPPLSGPPRSLLNALSSMLVTAGPIETDTRFPDARFLMAVATLATVMLVAVMAVVALVLLVSMVPDVYCRLVSGTVRVPPEMSVTNDVEPPTLMRGEGGLLLKAVKATARSRDVPVLSKVTV